MKRSSIFAIFAAFSMICATSAQAEPKPWIWSWWESHWENLDFKPYLEDGTHPHNSQWKDSKWRPEHWTAQRESALDLIRGFYSAGILTDQYIEDDVPVLEVGPAFYQLGGQDKRRVVESVDSVYQITASRINGMFMLYDSTTKKPIGSYTSYGLQIQ